MRHLKGVLSSRRGRQAAFALVCVASITYALGSAVDSSSSTAAGGTSCPIAAPFSPIAASGGDISVVNASGSAIEVLGYDDSAREGLSSGAVAPGDSYEVMPTVGEVVVVVDFDGRCIASAVAKVAAQILTVSSFAGTTTVLPVSFLGATGEKIADELGPVNLRSAQDPVTMRWPIRSRVTSVLKSGRGAAIFYSFSEVKRFLASLTVRGAGIGASLLQAASELDWSRDALVVGFVTLGGVAEPLIRDVTLTGGRAVVTLEAQPPCFGYVSSDGKPPTAFDCEKISIGGQDADFVFASVGRPLLAAVKQVAVAVKASAGFP